METNNTYIPSALNTKFESSGGIHNECSIYSVNLPASPAGKWLIKLAAGGPQQKQKR